MNDKYKILIFLGLLIATGSILGKFCIDVKTLVENNYTENIDLISSMQKKISIINIISFCVLTIYSLWLFVSSKRLTYLLMSLLVFVGTTLFIHVNIPKLIYSLQGKVPSEEGAYWLVVFVGIFYILGAVLVATIGYLVVRNYTKRYIDKESIHNTRSRD